MPNFASPSSAPLVRMLYMGDTGAGKTGSLCSLAALGFNVRVLDLDNGVEIFYDLLQNPTSPYRKAMPDLWTAEQAATIGQRLTAKTITETFQTTGGRPIPKGDSFVAIHKQLDDWKQDADEPSLGSVQKWGRSEVLVVDGLSRLAQNALYYTLVLNGRAAAPRIEQSDWWQAQSQVEKTIEMLTSSMVKCHLIICAHIDYIEKDDGTTRGMPQTIGKALSPKMGQKFNHALLARATGQGAQLKRQIYTQTQGVVDLKTTAPFKAKPQYELSTGLAEYFKAIGAA